MIPSADFVRDLSHEYERLHTSKEDAFWTAYMGLSDDADAARSDLDRKEIELKRWLQDPGRLKSVREQLAQADDESTATVLKGWERTLEANVIESEEGQALFAEIVEDEGQQALGRAGSRKVAGDHHHLLSRAGQLTQARGSDRVRQRFPQQLSLVRRRSFVL